MNRKALKKIADYLDLLPDSPAFYMGAWDCGTSACAIGWAGRAGLLPDGMVVNRPVDRYATLLYKGLYDWEALTNAFGLTEEQATDLFQLNEDRPRDTPKSVALRIRRLLKETK